MSLYSGFTPLIRLLKIAGIGVADFSVGLFLATVLDRAFQQLAVKEFHPHPAAGVTKASLEKEYGTAKGDVYYGILGTARTASTLPLDDGTDLQNPLTAPGPVLDGQQMKTIGLITLAQLLVTLIAGLELRNFFVPYENFFDPTGGIVFVLALLRQPWLWIRAELLLQNLYRAIWWFEQPKTDPPKQS